MTKEEAQKELDDNAHYFRNEKGLNKIVIDGIERIVTVFPQPIDKETPPKNFRPVVKLDGIVMSLDEYLKKIK